MQTEETFAFEVGVDFDFAAGVGLEDDFETSEEFVLSGVPTKNPLAITVITIRSPAIRLIIRYVRLGLASGIEEKSLKGSLANFTFQVFLQ